MVYRQPHPKAPRHAELSYNRDPLEALPALERDLRALMDDRLQPLGLTLADSRVLRYIVRPTSVANETVSGLVRARDIERFYELAQRSVQDTLQRLVSGNFITRIQDPQDRRAKLLKPTPHGKSTHTKASKIVKESYDDLLRALHNRQGYELAGVLFRLRVQVRKLRTEDAEHGTNGS